MELQDLPETLPPKLAQKVSKLNLPQVAQSWILKSRRSRRFINHVLDNILSANYRPNRLHRFLAQLPAIMRSKGYFNFHGSKILNFSHTLLVVTTCYDRTLERAFREAQEPFDLVAYTPERGGMFIYQSPEGEAHLIEHRDKIERSLGNRPVILKLYGSIDLDVMNDANFVITEDEFLNYLHGRSIDLLPGYLRMVLHKYHICFLGCSPNELKIKVSLNSILAEARTHISPPWFAIQSNPDNLDKTIWERTTIKLIELPLSDYVTQLEKRVMELPDNPKRKPKITWLHLSDWHQQGGDFNRQVVCDALIADIRELEQISSDLEKIDFIIFSGDVAFSGRKEEYQAAKKNLFEPLLEATGLSPERLFIVPGNHDLDRNHLELLPKSLETHFDSESQVNEWLTDIKRRDALLIPFRTYREFVTQFTGQEQPDYASIRTLEIDGKRVALLGINSALMSSRLKDKSGRIDDYGHLIVGEPQIHDALHEIENDDLRIAVLHHPFEWLAQFDRDIIERLLRENCHFILWSHLHSPSQSEILQAQGGDCVMISAGASYDRGESSNDYNFVHLDFETGQGTIYLRRWSDRRNKWIQDIESSESGKYEFSLPKELLSGQPKRKREVESGQQQPPIDSSSDTPYKGLTPYFEEDMPFFFGREGEREMITENLRSFRLTILYGASDVGKSSILRAGVAYHLRQITEQNLKERGTPEFAIVVFNSWYDNNPIVELMQQIEAKIKSMLPDIQSPASELSLVETLQAWTEILGGGEGRGRLFIILDQFEEYFLYHSQEDGERTFAVEFPRMVNNPELSVNFLISIREDALAKLDYFRGRITNILDNRLSIQPLNRESTKEAIVKPIQEYNHLRGTSISIEPKLVDAVLKQFEESEGGISTPYLQLVMSYLWDAEMKAGSKHLRLETLRKLGSYRGIVEQYLDREMNSLPEQTQDAAAKIFNYLVTPSGTKIAYPVSDLAEYTALDQRELISLLSELSSKRILRQVGTSTDKSETPSYEIFHDVLAPAILNWRRQFLENQ